MKFLETKITAIEEDWWQIKKKSTDVSDEYVRWNNITVICSHNTISMLWGNTAYCEKLTGEDLSRYWNKMESVGLRKCPYYHYLIKKVMWQ